MDTENSKAYRIWLPEKCKIDISRDVEFFTIPEASIRTRDDLMPYKQIYEKWREVEIYTLDENDDQDVELNNLIDENQDFECENPVDDPQVAAKRGRGTPRIIRIGLRGRPKNISRYQDADTTVEEAELVCLAKMPLNESMKGPNEEEWLRALSTEMKAIIKNDTWTLVDRLEET